MKEETVAQIETSLPSQMLWDWLEATSAEARRIRTREAGFDHYSEWMDLFFGKHYPETLPSYRPPVVINELRTLILQEASDLSDAGFRPYIMKDPRHGKRDEQAERALRAVWTREKVDLKIIEAITWSRVVGNGFLRVSWDPYRAKGRGDVKIEVIDARYVLVDPDCTSDEDRRILMYETVLDIAEIRKLFPKTGHLVKPEEAYSDKADDYHQENAGVAPGYPFTGPMSMGGSLLGGGYPGYKKARARVVDAFYQDDETEVTLEPVMLNGIPMKDENGNPRLEERTKMKYPHGRRSVGANGIILYDGPAPEADDGLITVKLEPGLGRYWGQGFVQQTGELQLAADKLESGVVENAIRLNNGIVVVKGNTGLDWENFVGMPAQVVQIGAGADFEIKYPPQMSADMVNAGERMLNLQRRILGYPEPRQGAGGRGNVSPDLTETEISQSQGVTRLRAKYLHAIVERLAEMIFARMAANYTTPRAIPAVEGEQFKPVVWEPLENPDDYTVYVDPGSFQILSRTALRRLALALLRLRAVDRAAALEVLGWPDWEQVSQRLDRQEQMMALAKMQQKKGKGR